MISLLLALTKSHTTSCSHHVLAPIQNEDEVDSQDSPKQSSAANAGCKAEPSSNVKPEHEQKAVSDEEKEMCFDDPHAQVGGRAARVQADYVCLPTSEQHICTATEAEHTAFMC